MNNFAVCKSNEINVEKSIQESNDVIYRLYGATKETIIQKLVEQPIRNMLGEMMNRSVIKIENESGITYKVIYTTDLFLYTERVLTVEEIAKNKDAFMVLCSAWFDAIHNKETVYSLV